jgi:hypothetical protein
MVTALVLKGLRLIQPTGNPTSEHEVLVGELTRATKGALYPVTVLFNEYQSRFPIAF